MLNVIAFSAGEAPCGRCGRYSSPMTHEAWVQALHATRQDREART